LHSAVRPDRVPKKASMGLPSTGRRRSEQIAFPAGIGCGAQRPDEAGQITSSFHDRRSRLGSSDLGVADFLGRAWLAPPLAAADPAARAAPGRSDKIVGSSFSAPPRPPATPGTPGASAAGRRTSPAALRAKKCRQSEFQGFDFKDSSAEIQILEIESLRKCLKNESPWNSNP